MNEELDDLANDRTDEETINEDDIERQIKAEKLNLKRLEIRLKEEELSSKKQDREQRKKYVDKIFYLECVYLTIVIMIIVALGNKYNNFSLDKEVIIALITTTTINVIGLFVIVAKYLFPQK